MIQTYILQSHQELESGTQCLDLLIAASLFFKLFASLPDFLELTLNDLEIFDVSNLE